MTRLPITEEADAPKEVYVEWSEDAAGGNLKVDDCYPWGWPEDGKTPIRYIRADLVNEGSL